MTLYAAIDLHSSNSLLAVLDENDHPLRQRRLPNELPAILKELEPYQDEVAGIVVESTYNWYWLVDGLKAHGYSVHLANTAAVPQYAGLKYSGDESDARHLAHLLRLGILPEGYIYPREDRAVRDLLRRRFQLVRTATGLMLSVQSSWARHTGQRMSANAVRQLSDDAIGQAFPESAVRFAVLTHLRVWRTVEEQVRQMERWIVAAHTHCSEQRALRSVPGIGLILGLTTHWKRVTSPASTASATTPRIAAWSRASASPTARRRATATANAAIATWPGRGSKRRTSRCASAHRSGVGTSANAASATRSSPSKPSRTS